MYNQLWLINDKNLANEGLTKHIYMLQLFNTNEHALGRLKVNPVIFVVCWAQR